MTAAALPAGRPNLLSVLLELTKFRISAASAFTAAMGYIAARRGADLGMFTALIGTVLLAMAASTLNEVQERELDARMTRTRHRPIPSGLVSATQATLFVVLLGLSGFSLLVLFHGWTAGLLGLVALGWYNGLYTPLKRRSAFAVVPGSVIGALPPAIGWTAAGGNLRDPAILALCFVFFVWQVPHFWLLALRHHEGYAQAGFPTLSDHFTESQIRRLIFTWTCATLASCALLPVFRTTTGLGALMILGATGLWLLYRFSLLLRRPQGHAQLLRAFLDINVFALAVMVAVILDAFGLR